jgi:hypothetical protein
LTALVAKMLPVDKGIYRIQARPSGKYMAVDNGSTLDGAIVEQQGALTTGADQWRLVLQNGKHRFINVKSGKCLTAQLRSERGQRRDSPEGLLDIRHVQLVRDLTRPDTRVRVCADRRGVLRHPQQVARGAHRERFFARE